MIGSGEKQSRLPRILAHHVYEIVAGYAGRDPGPRLAVVGGLENIRTAIVELIPFGRHEGRARIMRRRIDQAHPAELGEAGWRDLVPLVSAVARDPQQAVVGAGPDGAGVMPRRRD